MPFNDFREGRTVLRELIPTAIHRAISAECIQQISFALKKSVEAYGLCVSWHAQTIRFQRNVQTQLKSTVEYGLHSIYRIAPNFRGQ